MRFRGNKVWFKKIGQIINLLIICIIIFCSNVQGEDFSAMQVWDDANEKRALYYYNDTIIGNLDLSDLPGKRIESLVLKNCQIEGEFKLSGITVEGDVDFIGTRFASNAVFQSVTIGGVAKFENSVFEKEACFGGSRFMGVATFDNATFKDEARFNDADNDAEFSGKATFDGARFDDKADFAKAKFYKEAMFRNVTFGDEAIFSYAEFNNIREFDDSKFKNEVSFNDAKFNEKSVVSFKNVLFCDTVDFSSSSFGGTAIFNSAEINGDVNFANVVINADFLGAIFIGPTINLNSSDVTNLYIDQKYINITNLNCEMLKSLINKYKMNDKVSGDLTQRYNDNCQDCQGRTIKCLFFLINKHLLRWGTLDGAIRVLIIIIILTFFVFPLLYLVMGCLNDLENNGKEKPSLANRIYDCIYLSITCVLSQRHRELKRRRCNWTALLQFVLSAVLLFLIGYIIANQWLAS